MRKLGELKRKKEDSHSIEFKAGKYVSDILTEGLSPDLLFHNLHHTINVVQGVRDINRNLKLDEVDKEILALAAWFHDTGHLISYQNHELESQKIAIEFLTKENYPRKNITKVLACIGATQMPQQPKNLLQQIICDADLHHLSLPEYPHIQHLLREEWARILNKEYSDAEWHKENLNFLCNHQYFTSYGRAILQNRKSLNVESWRQRMARR